MTTSKQHMEVVECPEDIPEFASEDEEHQYWATHVLGAELLDRMAPIDDDFLPPARPRSKPVPIRFSDDVISRAKVLAARRNTGYQTLLKEFVIERLYEEERRAGLR
jgi:hypothetical protein